MALEISIRKREGVSIIDLAGRIVLGDGNEEVMNTVKQLLSRGEKKLLMNLARVNKVDSAGLGAIIAGYVSAQNQKATLKLLKPGHIRDLLVIAKLLTVFEIFDDEDEAIRSFDVETRAAQEAAATGPK